jgi:CRISPR-associated protein Csm3
MQKLHKKIVLTGTVKLLTGSHIGDSKEGVEIGGVDLPVVRRKDDGSPYLPGSSIKGKMRCLSEQACGINWNNQFNAEKEGAGKGITDLFGSKDGISRIIVRDAFLTEDSKNRLQKLTTLDMPYTEIKFENTIDRVKGVAEHPRQIERVPAGAVFKVEFVINVFDKPDANDDEIKQTEERLLKTFKNALNLLLDDYLGGHGSRGYGQIELVDGKLSRTDKAYRIEGESLQIKTSQSTDFVVVPSSAN